MESTAPVGLPGAVTDGGEVTFQAMIDRANEIKNQIDPDYLDELDGFASVLSGGAEDVLGDGELTVNEHLILNLAPDIATDVACSAAAVYGNRSETGQTLVGRITDWYPGKNGQLGYLNAVVHSRIGARDVLSFGWLGITGVLVGINSEGVLLANLYSALGAPYSADGRRSILLDMRAALACVNSFVLRGNDDNHTQVNFNRDRWNNYRNLIAASK